MNQKKIFITLLFILTAFLFYSSVKKIDIKNGLTFEKKVSKLTSKDGSYNPKWASLKASKTYLKSGPDFKSKTKAILQKPDIPIYITSCNKQWCSVRLINGMTGWVNKINISNAKTSMITKETKIYSRPKEKVIGTIHPYVTVKILETAHTQDGRRWCLISKHSLKGFVESSALAGGIADLE